jgi:hypothetical protein
MYITLITADDNNDSEAISFLNMDFTVFLSQMLGHWSGDLYAVLCISSQKLLKVTLSSPQGRFTKSCHVVPNMNQFLGRSLCLTQLRGLNLLACSVLKHEIFFKIMSNALSLEQVTSLLQNHLPWRTRDPEFLPSDSMSTTAS